MIAASQLQSPEQMITLSLPHILQTLLATAVMVSSINYLFISANIQVEIRERFYALMRKKSSIYLLFLWHLNFLEKSWHQDLFLVFK